MSKSPTYELDQKYKDLYNALIKSSIKNAITRFYQETKDHPKKYPELNEPELFSSTGFLRYPQHDYEWTIDLLIDRMSATLLHYPGSFFKTGSTEMKFLAQEFPIIYFQMFIKSTTLARLNSFKSKYRKKMPKLDRIPHLKLAYRNTPDKFKRAFNESLSTYYEFIEKNRSVKDD